MSDTAYNDLSRNSIQSIDSCRSRSGMLSDGGSGFFKLNFNRPSVGIKTHPSSNHSTMTVRDEFNRRVSNGLGSRILNAKLSRVDQLQTKIEKLHNLIYQLKQLRTDSMKKKASNLNMKRCQAQCAKRLEETPSVLIRCNESRIRTKNKQVRGEMTEARRFKKRILEIKGLQQKIERLEKMIQTKQSLSERLGCQGDSQKAHST